ncbi:S8 family serine peptidase [Candidatus Uabimicrobium sp. HlEnr_7]|uniref:S8 family serine peptidase n=1 Tax=Candidatus Uabimicrobium helgolandensis TaxID=3095367 RepID=UPI003556D502
MFKKLSLLFLCAALVVSVCADEVEVVKNRGVQELKINGETICTTNADIVNEKLISVNRATRVVTWTEKQEKEETPFYAINLKGNKWTSAKKTSYELLLKNYKFDPMQPTRQEIPFEMQSRGNCKLFLVQFATQSLQVYREELTKMGVEIHHFVPNHSYIVRMDDAKAESVKELEFVRWVGPMHAAYKMNPSQMQNARGVEDYVIVVVSKKDKKKLIEQIAGVGGQVVNPTEGSLLIVAKLNSHQLVEVSHLDTVLWINKDTPIEEDMDKARIQGGANYIESKFGGYTGKGLRGHVLEGIYAEHQDFEATEHRKAPIAIDNGTGASHGHSTFGQVFGSGKGNKAAKGMLPDAQGYYTNYNAVYSGTPGSKDPGSRYELTERLIRDHKIMFQTASWGYSRVYEYDARSAEMDDIIFNLDFPVCQSQSNAGSRHSRPQAWAKNIISGGALRHYDNIDPEDDAWARGASIGPSTDGRIKPDLCAFYDHILTTSRNGYTSSFGGTSGATPIIAGHVGLTLQLWTDGVFGNELKAPKEDRFANRPHYTTTKAILINTARQYSFEGENHDRTRVHQGWGFPNVQNMLDLRKKMLIVNEDDLLTNLDSKAYKVNVAAGEKQIKITLIWNEPAPSLTAAKQLINNLDLKVTSPNGTVYYGNNGLLEGMYSKAGGEPNTVDCVENVFVASPAAGTWTVEVIADEINADNHLETPEVDVDYALVVSGITK